MAPGETPRLVAFPGVGRRFETSRPVRLGDAAPSGRLRLDALARILQDVGADDMADAGLDVADPWVARRTQVVVDRWPRFGERLTISTFCSALGATWGERRSTLTTSSGASVEAATLWVHVDLGGRPVAVGPDFVRCYRPSAGAQRSSTRLALGPPPAEAESRAWPLRASDLDALGHVNNAAALAALEDELRRGGLEPRSATVEYVRVIEADDRVALRSAWSGDRRRLRAWLTGRDEVRLAAEVAGVAVPPA